MVSDDIDNSDKKSYMKELKIHQYIPTGNEMSVIAVRHRFDTWVGKIPWSRK